eukprot:12915276-Prorocentrum_lima.AAC.1
MCKQPSSGTQDCVVAEVRTCVLPPNQRVLACLHADGFKATTDEAQQLDGQLRCVLDHPGHDADPAR